MTKTTCTCITASAILLLLLIHNGCTLPRPPSQILSIEQTSRKADKSTVRVKVLDETKQGIPGVTVILIEPNLDITKRVATDIDGLAEITEVVPSKKYVLVVAAWGFETFSMPTLIIRKSQAYDLTVVLTNSESPFVVE